MSVRVSDLMAPGVVVAQPDSTVDYVRRQMKTLEIHAVPIEGEDGTVVGLVHSRDLIDDLDPETPVEEVMDRDVLTVELGTEVHLAARMMRQHRQSHLVVTDADRIAGIVSAFDFLQLVESTRFVRAGDETSEFKTGAFFVPKDEAAAG